MIGSIPARAGEPAGVGATAEMPTVYPRPRGGAIPYIRLTCNSTGLSPPARGSPEVPA